MRVKAVAVSFKRSTASALKVTRQPYIDLSAVLSYSCALSETWFDACLALQQSAKLDTANTAAIKHRLASKLIKYII